MEQAGGLDYEPPYAHVHASCPYVLRGAGAGQQHAAPAEGGEEEEGYGVIFDVRANGTPPGLRSWGSP